MYAQARPYTDSLKRPFRLNRLPRISTFPTLSSHLHTPSRPTFYPPLPELKNIYLPLKAMHLNASPMTKAISHSSLTSLPQQVTLLASTHLLYISQKAYSAFPQRGIHTYTHTYILCIRPCTPLFLPRREPREESLSYSSLAWMPCLSTLMFYST